MMLHVIVYRLLIKTQNYQYKHCQILVRSYLCVQLEVSSVILLKNIKLGNFSILNIKGKEAKNMYNDDAQHVKNADELTYADILGDLIGIVEYASKCDNLLGYCIVIQENLRIDRHSYIVEHQNENFIFMDSYTFYSTYFYMSYQTFKTKKSYENEAQFKNSKD